jgi:hypothetical protein
MNYYQRYYRTIVTRGAVEQPRGMETRALHNVAFAFNSGRCWRRERDNPAIGFAEGLQFISGGADKEAIQVVAPNVDIGLFGPTSFYGPRTADQFARVIHDLSADKFTRRAILLVAWPSDSADTLPCTTAIQFQRSSSSSMSLDMIVTMRSSDAVWGMPYDMIQFGMVHMAVANCVGCVPGSAIVNIGNAHVYTDHQVDGKWWEEQFDMPRFRAWDQYRKWAADIVAFKPRRKDLLDMFSLRSM